MIHSLDPTLDETVLAAVVQWRFHPATKDGVPIASRHDVYYHFPR
jgi:TonB-like protein